MKNKIFKLISFLMVLSLSLGSFTFLACAKAYDIKASSDELSFIEDLGVITEEMKNDAIVTRGEFTAMAVRLMGNITLDTSLIYSDVGENYIYKDEIATAAALGIIYRAEGESFYPDYPINAAAASKILVTLLGYEKAAVVKGDYPNGFLRVANEIGLLKGVDTLGDGLSLDSAVLMCYNALYIDICKDTAIENGNIINSTAPGKNLLTEVFDLSYVEGVVSAVGYTSFEHDGGNEGVIKLGGAELKADGDRDELLGFRIKAWYDKSYTLVAADKGGYNTSVSFDASILGGREGFSIKTEDKSYNLDNGFVYLKNGIGAAPTAADFEFEHGDMTLIDNNGDGKFDVVKARQAEYIVVDQVSMASYTIYGKNKVLKNIDSAHYKINGDLADIKNGTVISCYPGGALDADGVYTYCELYISNEGIKGELKEIGDDFVVVDDKSYILAPTYNGAAAGSRALFLISHDGKLVYVCDESEFMSYGIILGLEKANGMGQNKIKLLEQSGKITIFSMQSQLLLDGAKLSFNEAEARLIKNGIPKYQLVRYLTDKEGYISCIDTAEDISTETDLKLKYTPVQRDKDSLTEYIRPYRLSEGSVSYESNAYYYSSMGAGAPNFIFGASLIFSVPEAMHKDYNTGSGEYNNAVEYDDEMFGVISLSDLESSSPYRVAAFDVNDDMTPSVVLVYTNEQTDSGAKLIYPASSAQSYVVTGINSCTVDGEESKKLYAFGADRHNEFLINPEYLSIIKSVGQLPQKGDIIRVSLDSEGYVTGIMRDVVYKNAPGELIDVKYANEWKTLDGYDIGSKGPSNSGNSSMTIWAGKVFNYSDDILSLIINTDEADNTKKTYPYNFSQWNINTPVDKLAIFYTAALTEIVIYDGKTHTVQRAEMGDVIPYLAAGDDASYIAIRTNYHQPKMLVIYK